MGEIATWSAVKTKVGLGKDSNECPTKAELLALSPTGTGESYIGLEISNASSYGDNETIQLSDIHKVTYKYILALTNKTLNFTALGGAPTPAGFDLVTQKQKYLDGVAQSGVIPVSYNLSAHPDWIYSENGLKATENLNTQERYGSVTFTQAESGKSIDGTVSQAAATVTQEWVLSLLSAFPTMPATGGNVSAKIQSGYHTLVNGKRTTWTNDYPSVQNNPGWVFLTSVYYNNDDTYSVEAQGMANTVASGRSGTIAVSNAKKSLPLTLAQAAPKVNTFTLK